MRIKLGRLDLNIVFVNYGPAEIVGAVIVGILIDNTAWFLLTVLS